MGYLCILIILSLQSIFFSKIEIDGNKSFPEKKIIQKLDLAFPCNIDEQILDDKLKNILVFYKNAGYLNAKVKYTKNGSTLSVQILEGPLYSIGRIEIKGNKFTKSSNLEKILGLTPGKVFSLPEFENGIERILTFYENKGFPFIKISPSYITLGENTLTISLGIEEGPRLRWGKVIIKGNTVTKPYVIERQMQIKKGKYFSSQQLMESQANLEELPYIKLNGKLKLIKGDITGNVNILVDVNDARSNRIYGLLGYIPEENNKKGGFLGLLKIDMLNLFGTGRALSIQWNKQISPYTKLIFIYKEPWLFGTQTSLNLYLSHEINDTLYSFSKADIEFVSNLAQKLSMNAKTGIEKFTPAVMELPPARKYLFGTGVRFSNLDNPVNPQKGIDYYFYSEYGKKTSNNVLKFSVSLLNVIPLFKNNASAITIVAKNLKTNNPPAPEYEQFTLGGYNSLRGYRDRQFRAIQLLRISPEFRVLLSKKSRFYIFYDCAYFKTSIYSAGEVNEFLKCGYGIGVKLSSKIGIISIEYAIGEEKTFMKGKIHLGLDATF
ncbi:MAG: hypothetical protein B5M53_10005 [Candidatus Cloacimonas sp. 4484_209]|nr:MAG: hypothetical protein B5M53_10005 [Candidatus Cloacimonas sp. 4484_209]